MLCRRFSSGGKRKEDGREEDEEEDGEEEEGDEGGEILDRTIRVRRNSPARNTCVIPQARVYPGGDKSVIENDPFRDLSLLLLLSLFRRVVPKLCGVPP